MFQEVFLSFFCLILNHLKIKVNWWDFCNCCITLLVLSIFYILYSVQTTLSLLNLLHNNPGHLSVSYIVVKKLLYSGGSHVSARHMILVWVALTPTIDYFYSYLQYVSRWIFVCIHQPCNSYWSNNHMWFLMPDSWFLYWQCLIR